MTTRIRAFDWSATLLGPIAGWPQSLKTIVDTLLGSGQAMMLAWGPERTILYNDAYAPMMGDWHPAGFGRPLRDAWPDIWEEIAPLVDRVSAGETVRLENMALTTSRHGEAEQSWWTFSCSPVRNEAGKIAGLLNVPIDTTVQIRAEMALRESEAQYRLLFDGIDDGFCVLEVLFDENDRPFDLRFLKVNPAFERQTGLRDAVGRTMLSMAPEHEPFWIETYGRIARTGVSEQFDHRADALGRWYEVKATRIGEPRENQVAVVFRDVLLRRRAEMALHESEARYRALFDNMDDGLMICRVLRDDAGRAIDLVYLEVNRAVERQTGIARSAFIGRRLSEMSGKADFDRWMLIHGQVADTGEIAIVEDCPASTNRWCELSIYRSAEEQISIFVRDIDARKRSEVLLREREADLARVQRIGEVGGLDIDITHGLRSVRSPEYLRLHGLPQDSREERHADWRARVHADDRGAAERALFDALESDADSYDSEYRIVRPSDGAVRWIHARADIERDANGKAVRLVGAHTDVTEQKRSTEALRESEARLAAAFESVPVGVAVIDMSGRAILSNAEYRRFVPDGIIVSRDAQDVARWRAWDEQGRPVEPHDWPSARALRGETVVPGQEMLFTDESGREVWTTVATAPTRDSDGHVTGIVSVVGDIDAAKRAQDAIRDSEEKYRSLFETIDEGFFRIEMILDGGGRPIDFVVLDANPSYEKQAGLIAADIMGRRNSEYAPVVEHDLLAFYGGVVLSGEPERREFHHASHDKWLSVYAQRVGGVGSLQLVVVFNDITERTRAEAALRESEERQRLTVELVPALLWSASPNGQEVTLNEGWLAYTGRSEADPRNYGWLNAIHPDDLPAAQAAFEHAFATGEPLEREQRIRKAGDGWRWHLVRHVPVRDDGGAITRWFGAAVDIHESKLAEQALKKTERRLQTLVEGVPQLVWRAVDSGRWTWASPQWTDYTGQAEPASHDHGWLQPVHPDERGHVLAVWEGAVERGEFHADYRIFHKGEDRYRWFQTRATPVRDEQGAITEWLGTSTDVDDLRSLQERQHVLVAELQHRTRNLMGMVRSTADRTGETSRDFDDFRHRFRDRLEALARVQGLLSRLNETDRIAFDVLVQTEITAMHGSGERVTLDGPSGIRLRSGRVQTLAMALHELATNAVKYGALGQPDGHLTVSWRMVEPDRRGRPRLRIDWRESGVTMPPQGSAPQGGGQGRELIERALPYQLGAETSFEMGPDGVRCTITIPVSTSKAVESTNG